MALVCTHLCPRLQPKGDTEKPSIARGRGGKGREGEDVGVKGKLLSRLLLCECVSLGLQEGQSCVSRQIMSVPIPGNLIRRDRDLMLETADNGRKGAMQFFYSVCVSFFLSFFVFPADITTSVSRNGRPRGVHVLSPITRMKTGI